MSHAYPSGELTTLSMQAPLLETKVLKIARIYDKMNPPVTTMVMPRMTAPDIKFKWPIFIHPARMAPIVPSVAHTTFSTAKMVTETFEMVLIKLGFSVPPDVATWGIKKIVPRLTMVTQDAINARIEYENLRAMTGSGARLNAGQVTTRLLPNTIAAGLEWDQTAANPIRDIIAGKMKIYRACGKKAVYAFTGLNEYEQLQDHATILNQLRYTDKSLLTRGEIDLIKGIKIVLVRSFYKEHADDVGKLNSPGIGDFDFATVNATTEEMELDFFLEDRIIMTTPQIGRTVGVKSPNYKPSGSWTDKDTDEWFYKLQQWYSPVIEDYSQICVLTNTLSTSVASASDL